MTDLEAVFRSLKSELGLCPIYHHQSARIDGPLFISVVAYHLVHSQRTRLKAQVIHLSWGSLRNQFTGQERVTVVLHRDDGQTRATPAFGSKDRIDGALDGGRRRADCTFHSMLASMETSRANRALMAGRDSPSHQLDQCGVPAHGRDTGHARPTRQSIREVCQMATRRNRKALVTTETELKLIARAAIRGDSKIPVKG